AEGDQLRQPSGHTGAPNVHPPCEIGGRKVLEALDFKNEGTMGLPRADVLLYVLEGDAWACVRPSGTEPKLKIYVGVREKTECEAKEQLAALSEAAAALTK
ncbi:MAG: hypothetical protein IJB99_06190, partial [Clostridia bacterium]|nr:hypothetical protein [Clostridia bacterium]